MPTSAPDAGGTLSRVEFTDDRYVVEQSLIRNRYKATDSSGDVVLRGKQKLFKLKEEFPFETADGEDAFTVKAGTILDVAGDYTITDAGTGEAIVTLDKNYTLIHHRWKIRDPDTEALVAKIESTSTLKAVLRSLVSIARLIPHEYEITDADGEHVGDISGRFSLRDKYDVHVDDASDVPREAVVAAAMVIDAIENN
ncbi:MAG: LURP-one-related/scramblase family protein [Salinigranum sp.]